MTETTWLAALLLGLAGGGHCAGMCGGIAAALSRSSGVAKHPLQYALLYHVGRSLSYATAGAIVGTLGAAGLSLRGSAEIQQIAFVVASVALVLTGAYLAGYAPLVHRIEAAGQLLWRRIEPVSRALFPVTTPARAFGLGLAWGWLPCGMVYGALLLALSTGATGAAITTMLAFAIGTLPSLIAVGWVARFAVHRPIGPTMRRVAAAAVAAAGLYGLAHAGLHAAPLLEWCASS